jgi:type I restriction enzyme S subunit
MSDATGNGPVAEARAEWVRAPLARFLMLSTDTVDVDPGLVYPTIGVLNRGRGLLYRDPVAGSSTSYTKLNRIGPGRLVYSRLKAFEGAITVTPDDLPESFASQEFPTFTFAPDADPDFFRILTTTQGMWDALQAASKGMGGRRERVKSADFLDIVIEIPPLPVQVRIVEVIDTIDAQFAALVAEAEALRAVLHWLRASSMTAGSANEVRADEAFGILMGRQRSPQRATGPHMTPYLRSANVGYGTLDLSDVLEMDFTPIERKVFELRHGDVLVSEGSASEAAVGMPAMWRAEIPAPVCFQNTLLRYRAIEGVSAPAFVKHWCLWAYESGQFREVAGGTSIKHIGAKRAVSMPVMLPSLADQERIAGELDAMDEAIAVTRVEAARLRKVRASLLSGLLERSITITITHAELEV